MITPQGFHHVAISAADVERVARFYREVLGLPELSRATFPDGRLKSIWIGARSGGQSSDGFFAVEAGGLGSAGRDGFFMVALSIDPADRERVRAALHARGAHVERETDYTMYVRDPEGNLVGLSHYPSRPGPSSS
jgi:glyoxylase I family protein